MRHQFDHALALAFGGLREYVERRFDSLGDELAVVPRRLLGWTAATRTGAPT